VLKSLPELVAAVRQIDINGMLADQAAPGIEHAVACISEAVTAIDVSRSKLGRALRLLKTRTAITG
jgi:hypothetical protein